MNSFALPRNFTEDPEKLLRKKKFVEARDKFESQSRTPCAAQASSSEEPAPTLEEEFEEQVEEQTEEQLGGNLAPVFEDMAKTLQEFSAPTTVNIWTRRAVNTRENGFELKPALITMVQASQFYGKAHEDASAHLQHFLEICSTFTITGVPKVLFYSVFSRSHYWGKLSSGSTPTKTNTIHGTFAQLFSWQNSFLQPRLILCVRRFQVSNNNMMNHSLKHGKDSRITLKTILIMG